MVNSVYGKTIENKKKHTNIKLVHDELELKKAVESNLCLSTRIFNENLSAVEMRMPEILIDNIPVVGATVLEESKIIMYRFWYEVRIHHYRI